jgi:hypothetical protein
LPLVACSIDEPSSEAIYRDSIAKAKADDANAIMVALDADPFVNHVLVAKLIGAAGLPAIYPFTEFVVAGGCLMGRYGCNPERRKSRRHPLLSAHEIRIVDQSESRKGTFSDRAHYAACSR